MAKLTKLNKDNLNIGINRDDIKKKIFSSESRDDLFQITDDIKQNDSLNQDDKKKLLEKNKSFIQIN